MPTSTASTILQRIRTVLRAVTAGATYTYTLSDTADRVQIGAPAEVPTRLSVYISDVQVSTPDGGAPMQMWQRRMPVTITAFVPSANNDAGARILAALDLASDIYRAIESDAMLNENAYHLSIESAAFDGAELGLDQMGVAVLTVVPWWNTTGGI